MKCGEYARMCLCVRLAALGLEVGLWVGVSLGRWVVVGSLVRWFAAHRSATRRCRLWLRGFVASCLGIRRAHARKAA